MAGHDAVVHFAAESHVDRSIAGPDDFVHTNCFGTNVVMDTARHLEIARVVHIGTDEVYGSVEVGSSSETDPLEPRSPYSASKAGSDLIALSYHSTYGLPVSVTRCTNNFGPYQYPEKAIPLFTTNLLDGQQDPALRRRHERARLDLRRRPLRRRRTSCCSEGAPGEIYNIGAGNETPNRVLVDKLLALLGKGDEMVDYVTDRLGHDRRYSVDIAKITRARLATAAVARRGARGDRGVVPRQPVVVGTAQGSWPGMKILITGAGGQVGPRARRPRSTRHDVVGTRPPPARRGRPRRGARRGHVAGRPTSWCNGAAWTAVDANEADPDRAWAVNALAVRHLADGARRVGARVCHALHRLRLRRHQGRARTSSGTHPTRVSMYGRSKLGGELELGPGRHHRAHVVGVRLPRRQHGQDDPAPGRRARHAHLRRRPAGPPDLRRRSGRRGATARGRAPARACSTSPTRAR